MFLYVAYPSSRTFCRELFEEANFGHDTFAYEGNGLPCDPLANTPERILERREEALKIYDEMASERRVVLTQIHESMAKIRCMDSPPREWIIRWGERVWDFYTKYYSERAEPDEDFDAVRSFTKPECMRLARKSRTFLLGGYGYSFNKCTPVSQVKSLLHE